MKYSMKRPCSSCPFLREGGVKLRKSRIREIAGVMTSSRGGTFPCHKSVDYTDGGSPGRPGQENEIHCAGALIFAEKHDRPTQMMRIAERLGLYDRTQLDPAAFDDVWEDRSEWLLSVEK